VLGPDWKFGEMVTGRVCLLNKGKWVSRIVRLWCIVGLGLKGALLVGGVQLQSWVCLIGGAA